MEIVNLPPNIRFVLTETNAVTIVTGAGAYVYDKNGKLIKFYPEMGDIFYKHAEIINAVNTLMEDIEGVNGVEELRANATKTLASSIDALMVATEAKIKSGASAAYKPEEIPRLDPLPEPPKRPTRTIVVVKK
jgi:hypothetical protein